MKIALVHDYFTQLGGAENVVEELYLMLPSSKLFTTIALPDRLPRALTKVPITTSWMQHLPFMKKFYRLYFLLYPLGVSSLDVSGFDLVISSSSGYVKGIAVPQDAIHVCYCHTPMRWVWNFDGYSARESMSGPLRSVTQALISWLRRWDSSASRQPDHYIANSLVVADRIRKAYGREAKIIHPPVNVDRFAHCDPGDDGYYLLLSRLVSYKRLDLAIEACTRLKRPLIVVGSGPYMSKLVSIAGSNVTFTGRVSDAEVERYASRCRALIFPGEEDFGIAPLEVAAAGRPCIAYRAGGAIETVIDGVTGCFFDEQTPESLIECIERFETFEWSSDRLRAQARLFGVEVFAEHFFAFLGKIGFDANSIQRAIPGHDAAVNSEVRLANEVPLNAEHAIGTLTV
jgi:glycosyltransferase involved in cell wall biosynthesis